MFFSALPPPTEKTKNTILGVYSAAFQPIDEKSVPSVIVYPGSQFRHIICGTIRFDTSNLSEIIDRVRGIAGPTAAYAL